MKASSVNSEPLLTSTPAGIWRSALLGWLSFPLMVLAFSGLLIAWSAGGPTRPAVHRLEVVDIDATSGVGRGFRADPYQRCRAPFPQTR